MCIPNNLINGVLLLFTVISASAVYGQNISLLELTADLSSVEITTPSIKGMGVVLEDGATVATCAHVVGNNNWVEVSSRTHHEKGYVVGISEEDDIAIVRVHRKGAPFQVDRSGVDRIKGEFVVAAGKNSSLSRPSIRVGAVVSYLEDGSSNILVSSKTDYGFSGGPVMDQNGYLIGITKGDYSSSKLGSGTQVIPMWKILEVIHKARHGNTSTFLRPVSVPMIEIPQLPELDAWMDKYHSN
jgi:S1-C subfamily serine protease